MEEKLPWHVKVQNGELYVPPTPGQGFKDDLTQIPSDSEILQSFAELNHFTRITTYTHHDETYLQPATYQVMIGNNKFPDLLDYNSNQLVSPKIYNVWYFWTKEGCNIQ